MIARQNTARTFMIGPVLDADGVAVTDGVVGDFKVSKNGGVPAALNGSSTLTHRHTGHYSLAAAAGDFDTVGGAQFEIDDTVNGCSRVDFTVIEEAPYDVWYAAAATGAMLLQATQAGVTIPTVTTLTGNTPQTGDAFARLGAPVGASISADLAAAKAVLGALNDAASDGAVTTTDTLVAYIKQIINTLEGAPGIPAYPAAAAPGNAVSLAEAIRQIYDEVAGLNGGALLDAAGIRAAIGLASANLDAQLLAIDDLLDTEIASILAAIDTEVASILADTTTLLSRLTAALATKLAAHGLSVLTMSVDAGSTTTAVVLKTVNGGAPSATDNFYKDAVLVFTSGTLAGQRTQITAYVGATVTATVVALTGAPAEDDIGIIA